MNKEGSTPEFSKHLIEELDTIGAEVFTELGTEYGITTESNTTDNALPRNKLIEILDRMAAPTSSERHMDKSELNITSALLEQMGYPISRYDSILGTHSAALVADKLIEDRKDSLESGQPV